jgi:hypothetical protein
MKWLLVLAGILSVSIVQAAELRMAESVCQQVTRHVPDADVAFQPGVGADGRRVVPADINASPINKSIEKQVAIKIYNDAAKTFGLPMPSYQKPSGVPGEPPETLPLTAAETDIGYVTFKNGRAYLNGKPLDNSQQDELAVLCIQREKR